MMLSKIFARPRADTTAAQTPSTSSSGPRPRAQTSVSSPLDCLMPLSRCLRGPHPLEAEAQAQAQNSISMASGHEGQAIVMSLRHPRPSTAETDDIRSTADAQVSLRARRDGDRWLMEVQTNRYGHPRVQQIGPHRSRQKISHKTAKVVASIGAGLEAIDSAPVTQDMRPAHLPGPPNTSPLTLEQRRLIGVARFPDPEYNKENEPANQAYGERFHATVHEAGRRIADGQIRSLRQLWDFAGTARHDWARSGTATYYQLGLAQDFASGYPRNRLTALTPMIFEGQRYAYIAERLDDADRRSGGDLLEPRQNPTVNERFPHKGRFFMGHKVFQMSERLRDKEIKLTALKLPITAADFESPEASALLNDSIPKVRSAAWPTLIEHVNVNDVQPIMNHVESCFENVLRRPRVSVEALMRDLGEIHWWLAHAMPDGRGSAAKIELAMRALACGHGIDLPPFKPGIVPDLEAFIADRQTFSNGYAKLFEEPINPIREVKMRVEQGKSSNVD